MHLHGNCVCRASEEALSHVNVYESMQGNAVLLTEGARMREGRSVWQERAQQSRNTIYSKNKYSQRMLCAIIYSEKKTRARQDGGNLDFSFENPL